jgi:hypothetical protein
VAARFPEKGGYSIAAGVADRNPRCRHRSRKRAIQ